VRRRVSVATAVFEKVPDYRRAILVGCKAWSANTEAIAEGLSAAASMRRSEHCAVTDIPTIQRWRRAYRALGLNPTKTRPAVEAIIRRARGDGAPLLGKALIDAGTIATLSAGVPVGLHVLDDIEGDLALDFAKGDESFVTLQGDRGQPLPGELVWRSESEVLTRRWVHKQGAVGSVTDESTSFAVNLDLLGDDDVVAASEILIRWLGVAGIAVSDVVVLDRARPTRLITVPGCPGA
jgi:DNA/RNA-binding domain of Phe-tRNA-synthetase-like protein